MPSKKPKKPRASPKDPFYWLDQTPRRKFLGKKPISPSSTGQSGEGKKLKKGEMLEKTLVNVDKLAQEATKVALLYGSSWVPSTDFNNSAEAPPLTATALEEAAKKLKKGTVAWKMQYKPAILDPATKAVKTKTQKLIEMWKDKNPWPALELNGPQAPFDDANGEWNE